jgi:hypothetical protein
MAQTEREYLAGLTPPLAIAGARGRFSKAAKAELVRARAAGVIFADKIPAKSAPSENDSDFSGLVADSPVVYPPIKSKPKIRKIKNVKGRTKEGYLVSSDVCFKCCEHVQRCDCKAGIYPSSIVEYWEPDSSEFGIDLPVWT